MKDIVKEQDILLNIGYIQNNNKLNDNIDEDFLYKKDFSGKKIYFLNYMIDRTTNDKVFTIRTSTPIPYSEKLLETMSVLLGIVFIVYWIGLALWVYKDCNTKHKNASLWGF
jgi:hypothetical protein